jgi:hypothetical protein
MENVFGTKHLNTHLEQHPLVLSHAHLSGRQEVVYNLVKHFGLQGEFHGI